MSDTAEPPRDPQFVTALARGLRILRCFDARHPVLGTSEIARLTGLPQPTVWRLCHTLIQEGYLVQQERKDKLRPGIPILGLGYSAIASMPIGELAHTTMNTLAMRYQGTVSLGVRDGANMIYIQRCEGSQIILRDLVVGSRIPVMTSATGWAWLAGLDADMRAATLSELARLDPDNHARMIDRFHDAMRQFERTGFIINKASLHPQINAVGVPVVSEDGAVVMGLSSGGINQLFDDTTLNELAKALLTLAGELRSALTTQRGPSSANTARLSLPPTSRSHDC